jgi:hypothetical protein
MFESPILYKMIAERSHKLILALLKARFGPVPRDVTKHLQGIIDHEKLEKLSVVAGTCADLAAFRESLRSKRA